MASANIDTLTIKINANAEKANKAIDDLCGKLERLGNVLNGLNVGNLQSLATGIGSLAAAMSKMGESTKTADFTRLGTNLSRLGNINVGNLSGIANQLNKLSGALRNFPDVTKVSNGFATLVSAISKLSGQRIKGAIEVMPQFAKALEQLFATLRNAPQVSGNIVNMTNALSNFATQMNRIGRSSTTMNASFNQTTNTANNTSNAMLSTAFSFSKVYLAINYLIRVLRILNQWMTRAMDYVETYNYWHVAVSKVASDFKEDWKQWGYDSAEEYAESFSERLKQLNKKMTGYDIGANGEAFLSGNIGLGVNINDMMNFQARILSLTNSVGIMGEVSEDASQALSMLAADLSSLKNQDVTDVMENLTSMMVGQAKAGYAYGIDITNATLQQVALAEGVEKSVDEMSQSEKMQLRLLQIIRSSEVAWADEANTINSVANQSRILRQQLQNVGMTLGNFVLPIIQKVIPYINALVVVFNRLLYILGVDAYGSTWLADINDGISSVNFDDFDDGLEETTDDINNATAAAKKLKKATLGIDELNILQEQDTSSKTGGVSGEVDLSLAIAKELEEYQARWNAAMEESSNKADEIANKFQPFLNIVEKISGFLDKIGLSITGLSLYSIVAPLNPFLASLMETNWIITQLTGNSNWFKDTIEKIAEFLTGLFSDGGKLSFIKDDLTRIIDKLKEFKDKVLIPLVNFFHGALKPVLEKLNEMLEKIWSSALRPLIVNIGTIFLAVLRTLLGVLTKLFEKFVDLQIKASEFFQRNVVPVIYTIENQLLPVLDSVSEVVEGLAESFGKAFEGITKVIVDFLDFFLEAVETGDWDKAWDTFLKKFDDTKLLFKESWGDFVNAIVVGGVNTALAAIEGFLNGILQTSNVLGYLWSEFTGTKQKSAFPKIELPRMDKISFATGGFPEDGMFFANHSELVGKFSNGKTAVANNEQIVAGIQQGVSVAVSEMLVPYLREIATATTTTASKDFSVSISDRAIAKANISGQRSLGRTLLTNV